jgi:hypothetical protein
LAGVDGSSLGRFKDGSFEVLGRGGDGPDGGRPALAQIAFGVLVMRGCRGFVAVVACAIVGVLLLAPAALAAGTWSATGSLNTARFEHTATLLPGGEVLVAGGQGSNGLALASAELFDPATGTWSATGSLNTAREFHTATLLPGGKVLVAGGVGSSGVLASAELFSLLTPADLAAQLVADSSGKGPGKALADKATAIQTAVNAGQTATACAGITDYLGLVKAQTGKKLTIAQANQLTTDATDLADALGC